ncbi:class V aminotransferase [Arenicella chitinivorans]|uniref:Class V aminotransferase n=1 Tax=Arenicella chitinivorans TaxID=1329800 RepID=A0A918VKZ5_9GAMM|nr:aminotransferase class V-fold PLP-dependent enzyme [Arenicella chitinivorans]GHA10027.1 class V aminotransferase [Arenicella chitinivorans]
MHDHRDCSSEFATTDDIYLLAHSIGKMPRNAVAYAQQHFYDSWQSSSESIWPQWLNEIESFKSALAALFNADASEFCPQTNVSSALSKLVSSLPKNSTKRTIVMTDNDFPSAGFVLQQMQNLGFTLRVIDKQQDPLDLNHWADAIDETVCAVFITHVHYNTNRRVNVQEICRLARAQDAISIVDIAQSAGIVPIDLQRWQADAVIGSCIKWLCGGPGAGYLWVRSELVSQLEPLDLGWFSHDNPFEFDINHFEYAASSNRFWGGTPSVLPFVIATNSIQLINRIGVEHIRRHNLVLSDRLLAELPAQAQLVSPLSANQRGGTLVIKFDQQERVAQQLQKSGVLFDAREYGIRMSPHIYTQTDEIETCIQALNLN